MNHIGDIVVLVVCLIAALSIIGLGCYLEATNPTPDPWGDLMQEKRNRHNDR